MTQSAADLMQDFATRTDPASDTTIREITTTIMALPSIRQHRLSNTAFSTREFVLVHVRLENGIEGIGEAAVYNSVDPGPVPQFVQCSCKNRREARRRQKRRHVACNHYGGRGVVFSNGLGGVQMPQMLMVNDPQHCNVRLLLAGWVDSDDVSV